jgi:hypothetical protein
MALVVREKRVKKRREKIPGFTPRQILGRSSLYSFKRKVSNKMWLYDRYLSLREFVEHIRFMSLFLPGDLIWVDRSKNKDVKCFDIVANTQIRRTQPITKSGYWCRRSMICEIVHTTAQGHRVNSQWVPVFSPEEIKGDQNVRDLDVYNAQMSRKTRAQCMKYLKY